MGHENFQPQLIDADCFPYRGAGVAQRMDAPRRCPLRCSGIEVPVGSAQRDNRIAPRLPLRLAGEKLMRGITLR